MHKGAILALLLTTAVSIGGPAQSAEDRNQPKCTFHIFTDPHDHWALTEGSKKRKWLVMNVGDEPVLASSSDNTTLPYAEHTEVLGSGKSTIVAMKYGQP